MVPLGQGEQRGGDPVPGWEQVGQRGEEGEKVFARQGRGGSRGSSQMESWHHPPERRAEHVEGKTSQAFSSPEDADGRSRGGSRFASAEAHPPFLSALDRPMCNRGS